ncbi:MAG: Ig-like domain-containing protein [Prevotella sp.]|nr:Ig-like domain-containing protein [Prevotella sp.]
MGQPDGGWYDETPPRVIGANPQDKAVNVKAQKMSIYFNEYIKINNATENVVVSPPQIEVPEIRSAGTKITIELLDSLKENTTYTIDFSDAITDNNEDNPLGNFTYSFSTGDHIDTLEVGGYVLGAEDLEPVKGILVGLYDNLTDTIFRSEPMLRVGRTDGNGHFVIKGVAPGSYRIYALQDMDGNYIYNQKSEMLAFNHDVIEPSWKPDIRQDTLWRDSLRIDSIMQVPYTHFLPDDVVLRAFSVVQTDRFFLKAERKTAEKFTLFYSYGDADLPVLRGLNFEADSAFVIESSEKKDTITYWLRDSLLINQDTLRIELTHHVTDTLGILHTATDTLDVLSKEPYEKRQKQQKKEYDTWKKKQDRLEKKGEPFEKEMPLKMLEPKYDVASQLDPDKNPRFTMPAPVAPLDTSMIHLYVKRDTLWYQAAYELREVENIPRTYELFGEWRPDTEYSLEIDSAAFRDIYGKVSKPYKTGFKVRSNDDYSTLLFTFNGLQGKTLVAQLVNKSDKVIKEVTTTNGTAEFFYVKPDTYYLRVIVDDNNNGIWDTGDYDEDRQPEAVYYYPEKIECKAMWDITLSWDPSSRALYQQKPRELVKTKDEKKRTVKSRNAERARKMGLEYIKGQTF